MQVIGAGFGRTGTLSLKHALEELGFGPTYHMQEAGRRPAHVRQWLEYAETGHADWDGLFAEFGSGVDYPVSCVWEELATHYPDAKIILTVRDPGRWWESTHSTIYGFRSAFPTWFQRAVPPAGRFVEMVERLVWEGLFDQRFTDRDFAIEVFNRHVDHVRSSCPSERLLVFEVADGWGPLCEFLGVAVPDQPFPHVNDTKETRRVLTAMRWGTRTAPLLVGVVGVIGGVGGALSARRVSRVRRLSG